MSAFSPDLVHKYLAARRTGLNIEYHEIIDSTNFRAKKLGLDGAPHGTLVVADLQTAGRGRMQRSWESKAGDSILMTLLLRPEKLPPMQATGIVLIAAIAAALACCEEGAEVFIKWPNDLIANGKKLSGMLLEMTLSGEFVDFAVVGVGINVKSFHTPVGRLSKDSLMEVLLMVFRFLVSRRINHTASARDTIVTANAKAKGKCRICSAPVILLSTCIST